MWLTGLVPWRLPLCQWVVRFLLLMRLRLRRVLLPHQNAQQLFHPVDFFWTCLLGLQRRLLMHSNHLGFCACSRLIFCTDLELMFSALIISSGCANFVLLVLSVWPWPRRPVVPSLYHALSLGGHVQCVRLSSLTACLACDLTKSLSFSSLRNFTTWRVSSLPWYLCVEASFCLRIRRPALLGRQKGLMRGCGSLRLILPTWRPVPTE